MVFVCELQFDLSWRKEAWKKIRPGWDTNPFLTDTNSVLLDYDTCSWTKNLAIAEKKSEKGKFILEAHQRFSVKYSRCIKNLMNLPICYIFFIKELHNTF